MRLGLKGEVNVIEKEVSQQFHSVLRRLSDALTHLGIDWAVAGAVAANEYRDEIRSTTDLDVMLSLADKSVVVVENALLQQGWDVEIVGEWLLRAQHPVSGRLDVLVSGTDYEIGAITRANQVPIDENHTCKMLAIEDVVILKLIANRYRDNADVESILVTQPNFDREYMSPWIKEFELEERLQRIESSAMSRKHLTEKIRLNQPKNDKDRSLDE